MTQPLIWIASDHAGTEFRRSLQSLLPDYAWKDCGPPDTQSVDYPDYAAIVAREVASGNAAKAVLICGSGIGMSIAANRFKGVRAARVSDPVSARLSREHNDANILCLGSRLLAPEYAAEIVRVWLDTPFSGDARHSNRIKKLEALPS